MMMKLKAIVVLAALLLSAGCDGRPEMAVRTYELNRLEYAEAETLLTPYVREGGLISGTGRLLTVRETPDRLDSIAELLKRYDGAPAVVTLHFQVIEAGDFAGGDSAIARVEAPLRELFRYRGYRLLSDVRVRALEGVPFAQQQGTIRVAGTVRAVTQEGPHAGVTMELTVASAGESVSTVVSGAPGKTMLIGSQSRSGGGGLILAVNPTVEVRGAQP
jgi:hypothetical protein